MVAKTVHVDYKSHIDHIEKHSNYNAETGLRTVTKAEYLKLSEMDGLTPALIDAVNISQERVIGAAVHVATDDLKTKIEAAREAGDAVGDLKSTVRIATPGGSTEATVRAERTRQNPRTGEPVTKHGVVGVSIDADKRIPVEAIERSRSIITKALGLPEPAEEKAA